MSEKIDSERLAKLVFDFLQTELGKHYLEQLSLTFNSLHLEAEDPALAAEQKAFKIERAAGVKIAINWLTNRGQLLQKGYFDKEGGDKA